MCVVGVIFGIVLYYLGPVSVVRISADEKRYDRKVDLCKGVEVRSNFGVFVHSHELTAYCVQRNVEA